MSVRIYVEGGGDSNYTKTHCREAFHSFLEKIVPQGHQPKIIASGGRDKAFSAFKQGLRDHPEQLVLLLVDSEGVVMAGDTAWTHLRKRDGWAKPITANDNQVHLMVQCMEAWFLADRDALKVYYGQAFLTASLPGGPIELLSRQDALAALEHASRNTTKGKYHKTRHGFDLLTQIDPTKVCASSPHAVRLRNLLVELAG